MSQHIQYVRRAIDDAGSQARLAARMGCSQQQIAYLLKARSISAEMALKLEEATRGKVGKSDLRPDIWPAEQGVTP